MLDNEGQSVERCWIKEVSQRKNTGFWRSVSYETLDNGDQSANRHWIMEVSQLSDVR